MPSNSTKEMACELPNNIMDYKFIFLSLSKATGSGAAFVPTACIDNTYPSGAGYNVIYNNFVSHSANTGILTTARVVSSTNIIIEGRQYGWGGANNFDVKIYGIGKAK